MGTANQNKHTDKETGDILDFQMRSFSLVCLSFVFREKNVENAQEDHHLDHDETSNDGRPRLWRVLPIISEKYASN